MIKEKLSGAFAKCVEAVNSRINPRTLRAPVNKINPELLPTIFANGEAASRIVNSSDMGLHYNLFRFELLDELESATTVEERNAIGLKVAGLREFIDYLHACEANAKRLQTELRT